MQQESIFVPVEQYQLHLRHLWQETGGAPVLMIHGSIENGKIFYSESGKGLASYLANNGFDVYVVDLRGRGKSVPSIKERWDHGQTHSIVEDIPELINFVAQRSQQKIHMVCHSWGGVLLASSLIRFSELRKYVNSLLCFGTKRQVTVWNFERIFKLSFLWKRVAPLVTRSKGYLDAPKFKFGSDLETHLTLQHSIAWITPGDWIDPEDGFNYGSAVQKDIWPPTWHITGASDHALGHAKDVQLFINECKNENAKFDLLSKSNGNKVNYDHINILTHPKAVNDHFPKVVEWLNTKI